MDCHLKTDHEDVLSIPRKFIANTFQFGLNEN